MQEDVIEQELPSRPRRRLFSPVPLALLCVLLTACGFIGGVLVEKGQGSTTSSGSAGATGGLASRLASLRGGSGRGTGAGAGGVLGGGPFAQAAAGGGATTVGEVAYVDGSALYVTGLEGNTIEVRFSSATDVTRSVKSSAKAIHPGETVIVTGSSDKNGAVHAQSIRAGAGGNGAGSGGAGGGGPVLFGK